MGGWKKIGGGRPNRHHPLLTHYPTHTTTNAPTTTTTKNNNNNKNEGPLPIELSLATHLSQLVLRGNALTGTLSQHLYASGSLAFVDVASNDLEGTLPEARGCVLVCLCVVFVCLWLVVGRVFCVRALMM